MVEGGEVPTPHLFQIQMQLIWEEAGDAQSLLLCECATSPLPAALWWGRGGEEKGRGREGKGRGLSHRQAMLAWGGDGSGGGTAAFAYLGSESDLDHSLNYLFWISH